MNTNPFEDALKNKRHFIEQIYNKNGAAFGSGLQAQNSSNWRLL